MGSSISNIREEYKEYEFLCKKYYTKPVSDMDAAWLIHKEQMEYKDKIEHLKSKYQSYE